MTTWSGGGEGRCKINGKCHVATQMGSRVVMIRAQRYCGLGYETDLYTGPTGVQGRIAF